MKTTWIVLLCLMTYVGNIVPALADFKIALIGKTKNESFYEASFAGCQAFAQTVKDLKCTYDGPIDYQDPRGQMHAIEKAIQNKVDGLLISTTDSKFLVNRILKIVKSKNIPLITFDSDLLPEHADYRLAYVGTNNFDFGVALGKYAQKFQKDGLTEICIQSGSDRTPNLNERIRGVRFALSGTMDNKPLNGINDWKEYKRCPFYTSGKKGQAIAQMMHVLTRKQAPVFLAVAGFAQFSPHYIETFMPFQKKIENKEIIVISADAERIQLEALKQGLSTVNIGQRPKEMGFVGARLMYDVLKNKKMPDKEINYLGFYYCTKKADVECSLDAPF